MEMLFTASITFQLYRRFCGELSGDKQRLEKDNAETRSAQKCAKVTATPIVASGIRVPKGQFLRREGSGLGRGGRCGHVHELIDGEEEEQRLSGEMEGRGGGEDDDERCAGYAGGAFAADEQGEKHHGLLS